MLLGAMGDAFDIEVGQVIAGKFRIERVLGAGGMGVVAAATHLQLDETVALKFLLPQALENPEAVARFAREAKAAAKIKSEHVARVSDVGTLDSGAPYMVMEYLHGCDLKEHLARAGGRLSVEEVVACVVQACDAIAEAHAQGIIHRDLKPANLYRTLRADGSVCIKVLDFGISKLSKADGSMTRTATMLGSPYYMSPEQMTSAKDVDHRTDIWALGVIVHQLLTGQVPFPGETIAEVCQQVLTRQSPPLVSIVPDIPPGLQAVLDRTLAKSREDRFDNVHDLAAALAVFGSNTDERMADRISRVLGVSPSLEAAKEGKTGAMAVVPPTPERSQGSTLEGAAHTQLDYSLPTKKVPLALWGTGAAVLMGVGAWGFVKGGDVESSVNMQSPPGASEVEAKKAIIEEVPSVSGTPDPEEAPPLGVDQGATPSGARPRDGETDPSSDTTPKSNQPLPPARDSKPPAPAPQAASVVTPASMPAPAPSPAPAPVPEPAPVRAQPVDLYLDRQ